MIAEILRAGIRHHSTCGDSRPRLSGGAKFRSLSAACLACALVCVAGFAQSSDSAPARKDVYAELSKAPKKAAARRNPLEHDPDAVSAGAKLFQQHCAECHGELAEGTRKAPTLRAPEIEQATPGTLFWLLTNGVVRRGMPVWSKLPEPQRWQLVSYIQSLKPAPGPTEKP
jgi:mono/diheme cytochrome c family protein